MPSVTEAFGGGRVVTAYVPDEPAEAVVFCGDGQQLAAWGADVRATAVVGVHRPDDETARLHEYSPGFEPERFAALERFFVGDLRRWTRERLGVELPTGRTAVLGASAGGELALALGLRHPHLFGAVLCASPGAGFRPPEKMPASLPRAYLVTGTGEPFFRVNAVRWAEALRAAGADVVLEERAGEHGDPFWRAEFPAMVEWAFGIR